MVGRTLTFLGLCVCVVFASTAGAQYDEEVDYAKKGVYFGTSAAFGAENFDVPASNAWGFDIWAGFRPARYFGFDIQYEYLNGFDTFAGQGNSHVVGLNLRGYLPLATVGLTDRIQPYLLVGGGLKLMDVGDDDRISGYTWRLGGGLDYYITESFSLTASGTYLRAQSPIIKGFDSVSIAWGLQYRLD